MNLSPAPRPPASRLVRRLAIAGLAVAVLLAGCTAKPAPAPEETLVQADSFDEYALEDTAPQFGVIRGVVVDTKLAPMAGVLVELLEQGQNVTTTEAGVFAFKDVTPGTLFLKASLQGYESTQASVQVVAGVQEPEVVKMLLQRIPGTEPYAVGAAWDGFITCSLRIPAAGFNDGCGVFGDIVLGSTQRLEVVYEGVNMQWWQAELVWEPASATAERLCLRVGGDTIAGDDVCGASPATQAMNRTLVEANDLEAQEAFEIVAYPDHLAADVSGNLVLQQPFKIVHYVFHNFSPPEGWTFAADGEPVPPA